MHVSNVYPITDFRLGKCGDVETFLVGQSTVWILTGTVHPSFDTVAGSFVL